MEENEFGIETINPNAAVRNLSCQTQSIAPQLGIRFKGRHIEARFVKSKSDLISKCHVRFEDRIIYNELLYDQKSNCLSITQNAVFRDKQYRSMLTLIDAQNFVYEPTFGFDIGTRTPHGVFIKIGQAYIEEQWLIVRIEDQQPLTLKFDLSTQPYTHWMKNPALNRSFVSNQRQQTQPSSVKKFPQLLMPNKRISIQDSDGKNFEDENTYIHKEEDFNESDFARLRNLDPANSKRHRRYS